MCKVPGTQVSQIYRIIQRLCLKPRKPMCNTLTIEIKHSKYKKIVKVTVIYHFFSVSKKCYDWLMIIFLLQKQCLCITTVLHANATIHSLLII